MANNTSNSRVSYDIDEILDENSQMKVPIKVAARTKALINREQRSCIMDEIEEEFGMKAQRNEQDIDNNNVTNNSACIHNYE